MVNIESRTRRGKSLRKTPVAFCFTEYVFREKEFGIELEANVSDMWTPRDNSVLDMEWGRGGRTMFSK
jgi:hypothetical protein